MEDFILHLKRVVSNLPKKQRGVAQFILKNPEKAKSINLKELCCVCETTEPVIFALCKKLKVESFTDLKTNLALSLGAKSVIEKSLPENDIADDDLLEVKSTTVKVQSLGAHYQESIVDTLNSLDVKELEKATKFLKKANKVLILGVGVSGNVGHLMLQSFVRTGLCVNWVNDPNIYITYMSQMSSDDVCLILSQTGSQKDIQFAIETASALKIKTIFISSNPLDYAKKCVDVILLTGPAPIDSNIHISAISRIALPVIFVLDILAVNLMGGEGKSFLKKSDTTALFNAKRIL